MTTIAQSTVDGFWYFLASTDADGTTHWRRLFAPGVNQVAVSESRARAVAAELFAPPITVAAWPTPPAVWVANYS